MDAKRWIAIGAVTAAFLATAAVMTGAVKAADLGGSCCVDLEERIAELEATTARKGNRKVTLTLSGQVSRSILFIDNGSSDRHGMIDNLNSPSRLTFSGEAKMSKDWSAGYLIEIAVGSAGDADVASNGLTSSLSPFGVPGLGELVVRHNALWVGTPLGKVWLGHTGSATDGIVEINTANVNVAALPVASWTGFDGSRGQVLKWESPTVSGFQVSAAWTDSLMSTTNAWDAAVRHTGEYAGFRVGAGLGYADNGSNVARFSGSASLMHIETGLFVTANAGRIDGGAKTLGGTAGIERNVFGAGATTVFVEYSRGNDVTATVSPLGIIGAGPIANLDVMGFGIVQSVNSLGLDVFATYRQIDIGATDNANVVFAGARVKF